MSDANQSYENHSRYYPPFHFIVLPVLLLYIIYNLVNVVLGPGLNTVVMLVISIVLLMLAVITRTFALTVQDRVVRMEMRFRLAACLPDELKDRINELTLAQYIALRFASDEELPDLVHRVLNEGLTGSDEIKKEIKNWVPDTMRI